MVRGQDDRNHKANNHFLQSLGLLLQSCLWDNFVSNWGLSPTSEKHYSDYKWQAKTSWGAYYGFFHMRVIDYPHWLLSILSFFANERAWKLLLESLSKDIFEWRTSTGSGLFSFTGSGFAQIYGHIPSSRIKALSNTNLVASSHNIKEKASLPVDVSRSKTPFLKIPNHSKRDVFVSVCNKTLTQHPIQWVQQNQESYMSDASRLLSFKKWCVYINVVS